MSILQEYEQIRKEMGKIRYDMIGNYLDEINKDRENELFLSDILYKEKEYELFEKWFLEQISPFKIIELDDVYSISLYQEDYWYDWYSEMKNSDSIYGDGHCYEELFHDYLSANYKSLDNKLEYDSENGMFCVYAKDIRIADEIAYRLSNLYKNENKMIELIKKTKEQYGYEFIDCWNI